MSETPSPFEVAVFSSFEDSARAERAYYASLSPDESLDILLELVRVYAEGEGGEAPEGFARVHRVVELERD